MNECRFDKSIDSLMIHYTRTVYTRVQIEFFGRENGLKKSTSTYIRENMRHIITIIFCLVSTGSTLAGSTIMLLTAAWAGSVAIGRCDLDRNGEAIEGTGHGKFSCFKQVNIPI